MRKIILFAIFLLALPSVFSASQAGKYDDFEGGSLNTTKWGSDASLQLRTNFVKEGSYSGGYHSGDQLTINNYTIEPGSNTLIQFWEYYNSSSLSNVNYIWFKDGSTSCFEMIGGYPTSNNWGRNTGNVGGGPYTDSGVSAISGNGDIAQTWANIRIGIFDNGGSNDKIYIEVGDGTSFSIVASNMTSSNTCTDIDYIEFHSGALGNYDNFTICPYNTSTGMDRCVQPPETPALLLSNITYYNLTNVTVGSTGCENWNSNKNNACTSSALSPTVQFNTNYSAYCSMAAGKDNSSMNKNYTDMGESRKCTGAAAGEGTTSHLCTLSQDEMVYDSSYIFISCVPIPGGQELRNSTSGPLSVNITTLESMSRSSIEIGAQNALSSGYLVYTDQKVYTRNSANNQSVNSFDKVIKKLSKIWAFNRIGKSDSHARMFNITPVFYNFEYANKTQEYIINQTERLINSTR